MPASMQDQVAGNDGAVVAASSAGCRRAAPLAAIVSYPTWLPSARARRLNVPSTRRSPRGCAVMAGTVGDHVVETLLGGGDGGAHLGDLPVVLDEPQLAEVAEQGRVGVGVDRAAASESSPTRPRAVRRRAAAPVDLVGELAIGFAHDAGGGIRSTRARLRARRVGFVASARSARDVRERGPRAEPELADRGVGVELVGVASGGRDGSTGWPRAPRRSAPSRGRCREPRRSPIRSGALKAECARYA